MADVVSRGREVMEEIKEEMPVVREALSEMRTEPKNALEKIMQVCKDVWKKVVEVGLIAAVMKQIKTLLSSVMGGSGGLQRVDTPRPDASAEDVENIAVGAPAADTPLLDGK